MTTNNDAPQKSHSPTQPVRGTQDLLSEDCKAFRYIDQIAFQTSELYGFEPIQTPIFEFSEVFHRTLGETSDMVSKETYTFLDRGGDSITLRPEGTAGIARAFISNGLSQNLPLKLYYNGPMFRYERPQKGRYRQFHQIGVEVLGLENPEADVECIALAWQILKNLGLEKSAQLQINTLGDLESRQSHREKLVAYLNKFKNDLSADSQIRLEKNPLRILDSKDPGDQRILQDSPSLKNELNSISQDFFAQVLKGLDSIGIPYKLNEKLVRGIDYYTHTVFEFITTDLGAQGALIAGGRYDGLIEQMGGNRTSGVGWASGIERLALLVSKDRFMKTKSPITIIAADASALNFCLKTASLLRNHNHSVEIPYSGNIGKKMKRANKMNSSHAIIIGESEIKDGTLTIKNLGSGDQKTIAAELLLQHLAAEGVKV